VTSLKARRLGSQVSKQISEQISEHLKILKVIEFIICNTASNKLKIKIKNIVFGLRNAFDHVLEVMRIDS
jgi:hypothetical protein